MRRLFACLLVMGLAAPAMACINDEESPRHEREFRSDYGDAPYPTSAPSSQSMATLMLGGGGVVLLLGAFVAPRLARKPKG